MKQLSKYKLNKISKNLDYFFNQATNKEIKQGLKWYKNAHDFVIHTADKYNLQAYKVASVVSALSPRNKWEQNLIDADKVCEAFSLGLQPTDIKVCTFHTNKFKAFNILNSNTAITDKSLKTFNFVNNMAYLCEKSLTVDIWHLRACFNKVIKINSASIGRVAYQQIKDLTINKAIKLGLKGYELQAIIWISTQRLINNK